MDTVYNIAVRSLIAYFSLFILARLMGKREISQMTFFDYAAGITIGSVTAIMATDTSIKWYQVMPALLVFAALQILTAYISIKSVKFRDFVEGTSTVLVKNGSIIKNNLRKERLNISELATLLREKNIFSFADVECAILETDGKVSALKKSDKQPATPYDMKLQAKHTGLPVIIIEDGKYIDKTIRQLGLTQSWIISKLGENGILNVTDVMLAQVDEAGNFYVNKYNNKV